MTGVVILLLVVTSVNAHALAQPATPPTAASSAADAPHVSPPTQRKAWREWLDRERPLPEWEPEPERTWYGWQTLLVDALSISAAVLTGTSDIDGWFWLSIGTVTLASPLVHLAHLNLKEGLASAGMRLVPTSLFILAAMIGRSSGEREGIGIGILGVLATAIVVVLDAALFAWKALPRKATNRAWLTPRIDPAHGHIGLGYAANF
ncbi:MAG TPA: hypothetical protein VJV78_07255 [Polyangiales bacterium]|nr:hypothetical protein [Polyangiales bacterium]